MDKRTLFYWSRIYSRSIVKGEDYSNLNKVITRDKIIDKIFDLTGNDVYDNTVTVYIKRIREKLDTDLIKTIKGVGYRVDK